MTSEWVTKLPWDLIREKAREHNLEPEIIAAVIQTESGGNPFAIRCEASKFMDSNGIVILHSNWKYFLEPESFADTINSTRATEFAGQMTSWGSCQVMGAVAREHGFKGWFPELCEWNIGIEYGCRHLKQKAQRYGSDPAELYASYNAGMPKKTAGGMFINQRNVDHFMKNYRELFK